MFYSIVEQNSILVMPMIGRGSIAVLLCMLLGKGILHVEAGEPPIEFLGDPDFKTIL